MTNSNQDIEGVYPQGVDLKFQFTDNTGPTLHYNEVWFHYCILWKNKDKPQSNMVIPVNVDLIEEFDPTF